MRQKDKQLSTNHYTYHNETMRSCKCSLHVSKMRTLTYECEHLHMNVNTYIWIRTLTYEYEHLHMNGKFEDIKGVTKSVNWRKTDNTMRQKDKQLSTNHYT
jgi:hypothetical protein